MNPEDAVDLGREALRTCMMIGGPILVVGMLVGLAVGILQAMTQVQDQTVSFVPKILAMILAIGLALPWLSQRMVDYTKHAFENPVIRLTGQAPPFSPSDRGFRSWTSPSEDLEQDLENGVDDVAFERPSSSMPIFEKRQAMPTMTNRAFSSMPVMDSRDFHEQSEPRVADVQLEERDW